MSGRLEVVLLGTVVAMVLAPHAVHAVKDKESQYRKMMLALTVLGVLLTGLGVFIAGFSMYTSNSIPSKSEMHLQRIVELLGAKNEPAPARNVEPAPATDAEQQPLSITSTERANPQRIVPKRRTRPEYQNVESHTKLACCVPCCPDKNALMPCGEADQRVRMEADNQPDLNPDAPAEQPVFPTLGGIQEEPPTTTKPVPKRNSDNSSNNYRVLNYLQRASGQK